MNDNNIQHIIDQAKLLNHTIEIISNIRSGKEAVVYRVLLDGNLVAMKLYKHPEERMFNNANQYLEGKYYKAASHRKAMVKGNKFSKRLKHNNWIEREFFMLERLYERGARIPKPLLQIDNAVFMELLGDDEHVAPRLCDVRLSKDEAQKAFKQIIDSVIMFWNDGIVHADLSEYNVLWWNNKPYIIDFPQAIDRRTHPHPHEILDRDLHNITKFFSKYTDVDVAEIRSKFV